MQRIIVLAARSECFLVLLLERPAVRGGCLQPDVAGFAEYLYEEAERLLEEVFQVIDFEGLVEVEVHVVVHGADVTDLGIVRNHKVLRTPLVIAVRLGIEFQFEIGQLAVEFLLDITYRVLIIDLDVHDFLIFISPK